MRETIHIVHLDAEIWVEKDNINIYTECFSMPGCLAVYRMPVYQSEIRRFRKKRKAHACQQTKCEWLSYTRRQSSSSENAEATRRIGYT